MRVALDREETNKKEKNEADSRHDNDRHLPLFKTTVVSETLPYLLVLLALSV